MLAHREMVEALPFGALEPKDAMHLIVKETADACGSQILGLGFQVEYLAYQPCFPEESSTARRK